MLINTLIKTLLDASGYSNVRHCHLINMSLGILFRIFSFYYKLYFLKIINQIILLQLVKLIKNSYLPP